MNYLAQWGPKGFLVSPEKIVTFNGFSTSIELSDDSQNDTSGKAPTNTKGKKKQIINMSITYVRSAGVDPRGQFEEWESLVGKANPLYIGGKRFGPENIQLKKIDLSGLQLANDGTFLTATIAVSFEEYVVPKATTSTGSAKGSTTKRPVVITPLSDRQKAAYQQKELRLLAEKEKAMQTAAEEKRIMISRVQEREKARGNLKGGNGGYSIKDESLVNSY